MDKFFLIAGPQAAGKSTLITSLRESHKESSTHSKKTALPLFPLQESRQIIAHKYMLLGAIFMNQMHEREVVKCDFERMDQILKRKKILSAMYVDECNIFTIAHAAAHGINSVERYWNEYIRRLEKLNAKVIFVNVPVEISWERRKRFYEQRLIYFPPKKHLEIMQKYREYMEKTYERLHGVYEKIPFPKIMIDGINEKEIIYQEVSRAIAQMS